MTKVLKWLAVALTVVFVIILGAAGYLKLMLPNVGKSPDLKVEITPERVERGKYLATSVTVCIDCHSRRDWSSFGGPIIKGTEGGGGEVFNRELGFPGVFYSKNITPYGLGSWTDGDIYRAITAGVSKEGKALFPVMPYHYYGQLATEDIYSIIAYVRTLPSVKNDIKEREVDFPFNLILNTIPHKAAPTPRPDPSDSVAYGGYLVKAAGCVECHTKAEKGQIIAGLEFGGGREFELPSGTLRTPNITPDATGLGYWSREKFVRTFKQYVDSSYQSPKVGPTDFNTIMPWAMYAGMSESDLSSIYQYLKTVQPIQNQITRFSAKTAVAVK